MKKNSCTSGSRLIINYRVNFFSKWSISFIDLIARKNACSNYHLKQLLSTCKSTFEWVPNQTINKFIDDKNLIKFPIFRCIFQIMEFLCVINYDISTYFYLPLFFIGRKVLIFFFAFLDSLKFEYFFYFQQDLV